MCMLASCSAPPKGPDRALQTSAAARLQAIPAANPGKYRRVGDMRGWRNPYLIISKDGVGLLDAENNEERILKPEEVPDALAHLPASAWPYGRVVAVQENAVVGPQQDKIEIRRNRALLAGTLESLHVVINWVPSS